MVRYNTLSLAREASIAGIISPQNSRRVAIEVTMVADLFVAIRPRFPSEALHLAARFCGNQ